MAKSRRRGRGEGCVTWRMRNGKKLWYAEISLGYDENGKRKRKTVYGGTKKEVQDKLRDLQNKAVQGALTQTNRIRLGELLDEWVRDARASGKHNEKTSVRYQTVINGHIKPHIAGTAINTITPVHVQRFYTLLKEGGVGGRTCEIAHQVLNSAFRKAVQLRLLPSNPCASVDRPKAKTKEQETWTREQALRFLEAAEGDRLEALYVLALTTGARQGELFGLCWSNFDEGQGRLLIERQASEVKGKITFTKPKTNAGKRAVALSGFAIEALKAHQEKMTNAKLPTGDKDLIFTDRDGGPLRKSNTVRRSFSPLIEKAKIPRIVFHGIRHTHATLALADGANIKVLSERLGHADVRTTLRVYAHAIPSMQEQEADRIQRLFTRPKVGSP